MILDERETKNEKRPTMVKNFSNDFNITDRWGVGSLLYEEMLVLGVTDVVS